MKADYVHKDSRTLQEEPQVFTRWIDPTIDELKKQIQELKAIEKEHKRINGELRKENQKQKEIIEDAIDKLQLLIDIGFDYDGFNQVESLKTLIDELVGYAKESRNILKGGSNE